MDGKSLREHLLSAYRQTGTMPAALADAPRLPEGCEYVWPAFLDLHRMRGGGMGPAPITFADINAMETVTGIRLEAWEIDAIRAADGVYFEHRAAHK